MKIIIFECRRALNEKFFRISLMIGTFLVLSDFCLFWRDFGKNGNMILIQAWLGTEYQFAFNSLFYVLLPILACLPFAGSYFEDRKSGYDKNICTKVSRKKYFRAKLTAVFLTGFLAVIFPLLLSLFLSAGLYPDWTEERLEYLSAGIQECQLFSELYCRRPCLYAVAYTFVDGLIGGLMGLISIGVSRYCNTKFATIMSPFMLYMVTGILLQGMGGNADEQLSMLEMANPLQNYKFGVLRLAAVYEVVLFASVTVGYIKTRKEDIL